MRPRNSQRRVARCEMGRELAATHWLLVLLLQIFISRVDAFIESIEIDGISVSALPLVDSVSFTARGGLTHGDYVVLLPTASECDGGDLSDGVSAPIGLGDSVSIDLEGESDGPHRVCYCVGFECSGTDEAEDSGLEVELQSGVTSVRINGLSQGVGVTANAPSHATVTVGLSGDDVEDGDDEFSLVEGSVACADHEETHILLDDDDVEVDLSALSGAYKVCFDLGGADDWSETGLVVNVQTDLEYFSVASMSSSMLWAPDGDVTLSFPSENPLVLLLSSEEQCASQPVTDATRVRDELLVPQTDGVSHGDAFRVCHRPDGSFDLADSGLVLLYQQLVSALSIENRYQGSHSSVPSNAEVDVSIDLVEGDVNDDMVISFILPSYSCTDTDFVTGPSNSERTGEIGHVDGVVAADFDGLIVGTVYKMCVDLEGANEWFESGLTIATQDDVVAFSVQNLEAGESKSISVIPYVEIEFTGDNSDVVVQFVHQDWSCGSVAPEIATTLGNVGGTMQESASAWKEGLWKLCFQADGDAEWGDSGMTLSVFAGPKIIAINSYAPNWSDYVLPVPMAEYVSVEVTFGTQDLESGIELGLVAEGETCGDNFEDNLSWSVNSESEAVVLDLTGLTSGVYYHLCYRNDGDLVDGKGTGWSFLMQNTAVGVVVAGLSDPYNANDAIRTGYLGAKLPIGETLDVSVVGSFVEGHQISFPRVGDGFCGNTLFETFVLDAAADTFTVELELLEGDGYEYLRVCVTESGDEDAAWMDTGLVLVPVDSFEILAVNPVTVPQYTSDIEFRIDGTSMQDQLQFTTVDARFNCEVVDDDGKHLATLDEEEGRATVMFDVEDAGTLTICGRWGVEGAYRWVANIAVKSTNIAEIIPLQVPPEVSSIEFHVVASPIESAVRFLFITLDEVCDDVTANGRAIDVDPDSDYTAATFTISTGEEMGEMRWCYQNSEGDWLSFPGHRLRVVEPFLESAAVLEQPSFTTITFELEGDSISENVEIWMIETNRRCEEYGGVFTSPENIAFDFTTATVTLAGGFEADTYVLCYRFGSDGAWTEFGDTVDVDEPQLELVEPSVFASSLYSEQTFVFSGKRLVEGEMYVALLEQGGGTCSAMARDSTQYELTVASLTSASITLPTYTFGTGLSEFCVRRLRVDDDPADVRFQSFVSSGEVHAHAADLQEVYPTSFTSNTDENLLLVMGSYIDSETVAFLAPYSATCHEANPGAGYTRMGVEESSTVLSIFADEIDEWQDAPTDEDDGHRSWTSIVLEVEEAGEYQLCYRGNSLQPFRAVGAGVTTEGDPGSDDAVLIRVVETVLSTVEPSVVPMGLTNIDFSVTGLAIADDVQVVLWDTKTGGAGRCNSTDFRSSFDDYVDISEVSTERSSAKFYLSSDDEVALLTVCWTRDGQQWSNVGDGATVEVLKVGLDSFTPTFVATNNQVSFDLEGSLMSDLMDIGFVNSSSPCESEYATSWNAVTVTSGAMNVLSDHLSADFGSVATVRLNTPSVEGDYKVCWRHNDGNWTALEGARVQARFGVALKSALLTTGGTKLEATFNEQLPAMISPCLELFSGVSFDPNDVCETNGSSAVIVASLAASSGVWEAQVLAVKPDTFQSMSGLWTTGAAVVRRGIGDDELAQYYPSAEFSFHYDRCTKEVTLDPTLSYDPTFTIRDSPTRFEWTIASSVDLSDPQVLEGSFSKAVTLVEVTSPLQQLLVSLTLTNFLGLTNRVTKSINLNSDSDTMRLFHASPDTLVVNEQQRFATFKVTAWVSSCTGDNAKVPADTFKWSMDGSSTDLEAYLPFTPGSNKLVLDGWRLPAGTHTFTCEACVGEGTDTQCATSADFVLQVEPRPVRAIIRGATRRTVNFVEQLYLDASLSIDNAITSAEGDGGASDPVYRWSCSDTATSSFLSEASFLSRSTSKISYEGVNITFDAATRYACRLSFTSSGSTDISVVTVDVTDKDVPYTDLALGYWPLLPGEEESIHELDYVDPRRALICHVYGMDQHDVQWMFYSISPDDPAGVERERIIPDELTCSNNVDRSIPSDPFSLCANSLEFGMTYELEAWTPVNGTDTFIASVRWTTIPQVHLGALSVVDVEVAGGELPHVQISSSSTLAEAADSTVLYEFGFIGDNDLEVVLCGRSEAPMCETVLPVTADDAVVYYVKEYYIDGGISRLTTSHTSSLSSSVEAEAWAAVLLAGVENSFLVGDTDALLTSSLLLMTSPEVSDETTKSISTFLSGATIEDVDAMVQATALFKTMIDVSPCGDTKLGLVDVGAKLASNPLFKHLGDSDWWVLVEGLKAVAACIASLTSNGDNDVDADMMHETTDKVVQSISTASRELAREGPVTFDANSFSVGSTWIQFPFTSSMSVKYTFSSSAPTIVDNTSGRRRTNVESQQSEITVQSLGGTEDIHLTALTWRAVVRPDADLTPIAVTSIAVGSDMSSAPVFATIRLKIPIEEVDGEWVTSCRMWDGGSQEWQRIALLTSQSDTCRFVVETAGAYDIGVFRETEPTTNSATGDDLGPLSFLAAFGLNFTATLVVFLVIIISATLLTAVGARFAYKHYARKNYVLPFTSGSRFRFRRRKNGGDKKPMMGPDVVSSSAGAGDRADATAGSSDRPKLPERFNDEELDEAARERRRQMREQEGPSVAEQFVSTIPGHIALQRSTQAIMQEGMRFVSMVQEDQDEADGEVTPLLVSAPSSSGAHWMGQTELEQPLENEEELAEQLEKMMPQTISVTPSGTPPPVTQPFEFEGGGDMDAFEIDDEGTTAFPSFDDAVGINAHPSKPSTADPFSFDAPTQGSGSKATTPEHGANDQFVFEPSVGSATPPPQSPEPIGEPEEEANLADQLAAFIPTAVDGHSQNETLGTVEHSKERRKSQVEALKVQEEMELALKERNIEERQRIVEENERRIQEEKRRKLEAEKEKREEKMMAVKTKEIEKELETEYKRAEVEHKMEVIEQRAQEAQQKKLSAAEERRRKNRERLERVKLRKAVLDSFQGGGG